MYKILYIKGQKLYEIMYRIKTMCFEDTQIVLYGMQHPVV